MKQKLMIVIILFTIGFGVFIYEQGKEKSKEKYIITDESIQSSEVCLSVTPQNDSSDTENSDSTVCCYVCGEVSEAGVYYLEEGARINDAILAAGGFSELADTQYLNLAVPVTDGMRIYVPSTEEVENKTYIDISDGEKDVITESVSGLININIAGKEQLSELPGIGESKAEAIIKYRNDSGGFVVIEDIMKVSGIGESIFQKLKDYITV